MDGFVTWGRVEPHAQTTDLDVGLAAEVADPLWLLLRQYQLGELTGDDAGSPVAIDVASSWSRFSRYRADGGDTPGDPLPITEHTGPVERLVESEPVIRLGGDARGTPWTAAVRAGRSLRRRLVAAGMDAVADRLATDGGTTFTADPVADVVESFDDARYRALLAGRAIDGAKVLDLHRGAGLPAAVVSGADPGRLATEMDAWAADLEQDWGVSDAAADRFSPAWVRERLEYNFSVAAPPLPGGEGELVLTAAEYDGTGVEWYSLDLDADPDLPLGAGDDLASDPSPGRPADPHAAARGAQLPGHAGRPVLGDGGRLGRSRPGRRRPDRPGDGCWPSTSRSCSAPTGSWCPVEVPVGCVARVDWVVVRDTFGGATLVGTTTTQGADSVGRQFQPSNLRSPDGVEPEGDNPLLVVLSSAMGALNSEPREEVALQRDEVANLVWSIEKQVMGPTGRGITRPWFRSEFDLPAALTPDDYDLVWRLATPVAETWTPMVAVHEDDGPRLLRKARLLDTATTELRAAKSQLLADIQDVREEEVTRAGVQLRILEQHSRGPDGRAYVWRGREKRPWKGEAASGLRFDAATPRPEA